MKTKFKLVPALIVAFLFVTFGCNFNYANAKVNQANLLNTANSDNGIVDGQTYNLANVASGSNLGVQCLQDRDVYNVGVENSVLWPYYPTYQDQLVILGENNVVAPYSLVDFVLCQKWTFNEVGEGNYVIKSGNPNLALEYDRFSNQNENKANIYLQDGTAYELFKVNKFDNGQIQIAFAPQPDLVLTITDPTCAVSGFHKNFGVGCVSFQHNENSPTQFWSPTLTDAPPVNNEPKHDYDDANTLPTLTGHQVDDFVNVALSQADPSVHETAGSGYNIFNRFMFNYENGYDWCATFVSWSAAMANIPVDIINPNALATGFTVAPYTSAPQRGDIVEIAFHGATKAHHVAIVLAVNEANNQVQIVEGNHNDDPNSLTDAFHVNTRWISLNNDPAVDDEFGIHYRHPQWTK